MTSESSGAVRRRALRGVLGVVLGALWPAASGCEGPQAGVPVGSNTNWLVACDESAACGGDGACVCGTCTLECSSDADCDAVPNARCVTVAETAARSQCRSDEPPLGAGICLAGCEPGGCGVSGGACVNGACVGLRAPDAELCTALAAPSDVELRRQDGLLALVEELRSLGGVECGSAAASLPVAELRWDARLACAARALAADMAVSRVQSLVDSAGRDTATRLALVGYSQRIWGEAFALVPGEEGAALAAMLSDVDSCARFVDARFSEIGVGSAGDAYVVTIGAE